MTAAHIGDEDWGIDAGRSGDGLAIFALVFGGLSVVASLGATDWSGFSTLFKFALSVWDSALRFVLSPLFQPLESLIEQLRASGLEGAALRASWPHNLTVSLLVGVAGFQITARGGAWILGVAWFVVVCSVGFAVLSNTNPIDLGSIIGKSIGGAAGESLLAGILTVAIFGFVSVTAIIGLWFDFMGPMFSDRIGLVVALGRVFVCFIGAGLYFLLDYAVRTLVG